MGLYSGLGAVVALGIFAFMLSDSTSALARPKYGPEGAPRAIPLNRDRDFFRRAGAPDFWRLMPYYVPQFNGAACGVASASMMLNGFVARRTQAEFAPSKKQKASDSTQSTGSSAKAKAVETSDDKLVLQTDLLEKVHVENWKERILGGTGVGAVLQSRGTDLDTLGKIVSEALKQFQFEGAKIEVVHVEGADAAWVTKVRTMLRENEASDRDLVITNFIQAEFTDDADVGHLAPVGAYDEKTDRVLVLDPDREYYEPYWVKVETFVKGMATLDSSVKKKRGYIRVTLAE